FFTSSGAFALVVGLLLTGPQAAWARKNSLLAKGAPLTLSGCKTLSASNTIYQLTSNISTSATGDCIILTGSNDTLDLQGHNITFTGTQGTSAGAGVHINQGSDDVFEGDNSTITGFAEGVLDNGANTMGDDVNLISGGIGLELTGGTDLWHNFAVIDNTAQGVYLKSCSDECA